MKETNWERWEAATGYLVLALGMVAASFERGAPPASAPAEETLAFFATYRSELLAQSLLFVLSAGLYLWFFGSLRSFLARAKGGSGRLSTVAFGAGVIWAAIQMVFQSGQVALALGAGGDLTPAMAGMISDQVYALSVIAYVPMAIMLAAVAVLSFRNRAFPAWVGCLSAAAATANLVMSFGIVAESGLLVPGGPMTYLLYALTAVWPAAVTTVMVMRLGKPASGPALNATPEELHDRIGPRTV